MSCSTYANQDVAVYRQTMSIPLCTGPTPEGGDTNHCHESLLSDRGHHGGHLPARSPRRVPLRRSGRARLFGTYRAGRRADVGTANRELELLAELEDIGNQAMEFSCVEHRNSHDKHHSVWLDPSTWGSIDCHTGNSDLCLASAPGIGRLLHFWASRAFDDDVYAGINRACRFSPNLILDLDPNVPIPCRKV